MILNKENVSVASATRTIFFIDKGAVYILADVQGSFAFVPTVTVFDYRYKGKKRNTVIESAIRNHEVHCVETYAEMFTVLKNNGLL